MIYFPICKINLGLSIIAKREDGYHELSTLMYPVTRLCDTLEIVHSEEFSFTSSGLELDCASEDNLCIKAYKLMQSRYDLPPVAMHLHKVIPFGAGLAGGSADASYVLRALNEVFRLALDNTTLKQMAAELGSDTVFFIDNKPCYATGRGDILSPSELSLSGYTLVIVKANDIFVSTKQAYSGVKCGLREPSDLENLPIERWADELVNDFEDNIFELYPRLKHIKQMLYQRGAIYASMSGSGSAIYGIFKQEPSEPIELEGVFVHQEKIF